MSENREAKVNFSNYEEALKSGNVILSAKEREAKILSGVKEIERESGAEVEFR